MRNIYSVLRNKGMHLGSFIPTSIMCRYSMLIRNRACFRTPRAPRQIMNKRGIYALLTVLTHVLNSLGLTEVETTSEEVESVMLRAFLESSGEDQNLTSYEVRTKTQ